VATGFRDEGRWRLVYSRDRNFFENSFLPIPNIGQLVRLHVGCSYANRLCLCACLGIDIMS
jgi:hypothetical protein